MSLSCVFCCLSVAPVMERVSGNTVEFEMSSLTPATLYTVKVYAFRETAKSAATSTDFTTGEAMDTQTPQHIYDHLLYMFGLVATFEESKL